MSDAKKNRVNFTKDELTLVKNLVLQRPIIEKKMHDQKTESLRKAAWIEVHDYFNSEGLNIPRNIEQLKGAWKRVKKEYKSQKAAERRSIFKTGGGPPPPPADQDDKDIEMDELFSDQTPLENIPDDDDDIGVEDRDTIPLSARVATASPADSLATPSNSRATTPAAVSKNKTTTRRVTTFAEEYHKKRMEHLTQEHELRMKVLEEEMSYWALKKQLAQPNSDPAANLSGITSEAKTFHLLGETIQEN